MRKLFYLMLAPNEIQENKVLLELVPMKNVTVFLRNLKTAAGLPHIDYQFKIINGVLFLFSGKNIRNIFLDNKSPSTLGFKRIHDESGYHIGYKMFDTLENLTMADDN